MVSKARIETRKILAESARLRVTAMIQVCDDTFG